MHYLELNDTERCGLKTKRNHYCKSSRSKLRAPQKNRKRLDVFDGFENQYSTRLLDDDGCFSYEGCFDLKLPSIWCPICAIMCCPWFGIISVVHFTVAKTAIGNDTLYLGCCKLENEILKEAKNLEK